MPAYVQVGSATGGQWTSTSPGYDSGNRVSCRNLFKKLEILPLTSQCMLSFLMFVVQNKQLFLTYNENHNLDTR